MNGQKITAHETIATRRMAVAIFAALLLAGQALALLHTLDLSAHHDGDPCELCLHLGVLDHGLDNPAPVLPVTAVSPPQTIVRFSPAFPSTPRRYDSRAPPRAA